MPPAVTTDLVKPMPETMSREQWLHRYRAHVNGLKLPKNKLRMLLDTTSAAYEEYSRHGWANDPEGAANLTVSSMAVEGR